MQRSWVLIALILTACHAAPPPTPPAAVIAPAPKPASTALPDYGTLPALQLVDQDAAPFTRERMQGRVWIANFIYTTCHMACPMLSARMAFIQSHVTAEPPALQLVSFSILPDTDTPPVMKEYSVRYHRDAARWTFVTGKPDALLASVSGGLEKAAADDPKLRNNADSNFVSLHGEMFVLIDADNHIRGYYRKDDPGVERLIADASRLAKGVSVKPVAHG